MHYVLFYEIKSVIGRLLENVGELMQFFVKSTAEFKNFRCVLIEKLVNDLVNFNEI